MLIPSKHSGYSRTGVRLYPGKSSPPPPPDYQAAAKETASGNREAAEYTTKANRINQFTPYGSLTYDYKPQTAFDEAGYNKAVADASTVGGAAPDRNAFMKETGAGWSQTQTLTPQAQATLDKNLALSDKYAETAGIGFDKARATFENPNIDQSLLPSAPINAGMTAQQAMMSRLQPTLERNEEALRTRLANQGIGLGSQAYGREMNLQGQQANDMYLQSMAQGINMDAAARERALNEAYTAQSRPLDLINALRTGSQVQNPQFQSFANQANVAGPDLLGAVGQQYNAELSGVNAENAASAGMMQGLGSLAMTGAKMGMFSDRRMKENITKIGSLDNGLNLYKFDYKPEFKDIAGSGTYVGVMADEAQVIPDAVIRQSNGYDMVDYSKVY
jgi:hypothetical protein